MTEERYSGDVSRASEVRARPADGEDLYLEWMTMDGTIMTVTTIKISRSGARKTLAVLDGLRAKLEVMP